MLRMARESGSIELMGKMWDRTWQRLGTGLESGIGGGKREIVREGGSMGGFLDRLTINFMSPVKI